jgi:predicted Zn-dependent protease with MMP-like domain
MSTAEVISMQRRSRDRSTRRQLPNDRALAPAPAGEIALMTDAEFDLLLDEVERQARMPFAPAPPPAADMDGDDDFAEMVRDALDELPDFVQVELQRSNLGVTISDWGSEWNALGLYCGGSIAEDDFPHTITIFRDTLTAHYGHDPDELRRQVKITVRHEVAHHFGANVRGVRELGL